MSFEQMREKIEYYCPDICSITIDHDSCFNDLFWFFMDFGIYPNAVMRREIHEYNKKNKI